MVSVDKAVLMTKSFFFLPKLILAAVLYPSFPVVLDLLDFLHTAIEEFYDSLMAILAGIVGSLLSITVKEGDISTKVHEETAYFEIARTRCIE